MRKSQPRNGKYKDSNGDFRTKVYIYQIKTSKDRLSEKGSVPSPARMSNVVLLQALIHKSPWDMDRGWRKRDRDN